MPKKNSTCLDERSLLEQNDPQARTFLSIRGLVTNIADGLFDCETRSFLRMVLLPKINEYRPKSVEDFDNKYPRYPQE